MSTYTDLHNRIKESIAVDSRTRITPQPVRMLNDQNEFWGTFVGTLSANQIGVVGGTIRDVIIDNAELRNVKGLSGIDLDSMSQQLVQLSTDFYSELPDLERCISQNSQNIAQNTTAIAGLSERVTTVSVVLDEHICDTVGQMSSIIAEKISDKFDELSVKQDTAFEALVSETAAKVNQLSNDVDQRLDSFDQEIDTFEAEVDDRISSFERQMVEDLSDLNDARLSDRQLIFEQYYKEFQERIQNDTTLSLKFDTITRLQDEKYVELSNAISSHADENTAEFADVRSETAAEIEEKRHYSICPIDYAYSYPLSVKDFSVNTYRVDLPDALVYDSDENEPTHTTPVGYVCKKSDSTYPLDFVTYSLKGMPVEIALDDDFTYSFNDGTTKPTGKNNYTIKYRPGADYYLSSAIFVVKSTHQKYNDAYLFNTKVANVTEMLSSDDNKILSGKIRFNTAMSDLSVIDQTEFEFNGADLSVWTSPMSSEQIVYDGVDSFEVRTGLIQKKYFVLKDSREIQNVFGLVNEGGVVWDDLGSVSSINADIFSPLTASVELNSENSFTAELSSDLSNKIILSCDIATDQQSGKFTVANVQEMYEYGFYKELSAHTLENKIGRIMIPSINSDISCKDYDVISVDMTSAFILPEFDKIWEVPTEDHETWYLAVTDPETKNLLNISFVYPKLRIDSYKTANCSYIHRQYDVDALDKTVTNPDTAVTTLYQTAETTLDEYNSSRPSYTAWPVVIDHNEKTTGGKEFGLKLTAAAEQTDIIKFQIPEKTTAGISREFIINLNVIKTGISRIVELKFVNADGTDVTIVNQRENKLRIKTNEQTTLQLNELANGQFLVTDLDANEDDWTIAKLSNDVTALSAANSELTEQLTDLSASYSNTFVPTADETGHIKSDNLILTDVMGSGEEPHAHQKYMMAFENGTIVLKPIS